jgi:hypothetical protein
MLVLPVNSLVQKAQQHQYYDNLNVPTKCSATVAISIFFCKYGVFHAVGLYLDGSHGILVTMSRMSLLSKY